MEALILVKAFLLQFQQAEFFHIVLGGWINLLYSIKTFMGRNVPTDISGMKIELCIKFYTYS